MTTWKLSEVRRVLTGYAPRKNICNETWEAWKRAAGVKPYERICDLEIAIRLCLCCKARRQGQPIRPLKIKIEARQVSHPSEVIPGLMLERSFDSLPTVARGDELGGIFLARWDHQPSDRSFRRYVESANLGTWSPSREFSRSEIAAIEREYIRRRQSEIKSGLHLAQNRKPKIKVEAA